MPEHSSFQDMFFPAMLFISKYAKSYASIMDISLMKITLGQQYSVGEKPTVILYTYINRHADTRKTVKTKQKQCSTPSNMAVIIYYYIGYKYNEATTWYLTGFPIMVVLLLLVVTLGQQYNVGEKPTVILYTYINHHAEPPNIIEHETLYCM